VRKVEPLVRAVAGATARITSCADQSADHRANVPR
jgi:hypothetical protein